MGNNDNRSRSVPAFIRVRPRARLARARSAQAERFRCFGVTVFEEVEAEVTQQIAEGALGGGITDPLEALEAGVEQFLRVAGCHLLQGYLFSPTVPTAEIDAFIRDGWPASR